MNKTWLCISFCFSILMTLYGQPVLSTKRTVNGVDIYQDHQVKHQYYYSPPDIHLKSESTGAPSFILLEMRYTGTHLYGDQANKGFHNILQLSIVLEPMPGETYDQIKETLGQRTLLKPLPIKKFHGELIIPLGDADAANEKYRKVSLSGVEGEVATPGYTFWQERTYTLQLDNHEAQLLWDQIETGKLGLSFSYSFYAEAMPGQIADLEVSGTTEDVVEEMGDAPEETLYDDNVNLYLVKANTFPIHIDVNEFPECLRKVDVNEELPPAYASFEVRCYDFTDDLRPDLFKKIVEIKAFGAAKEFITVKADFNRNKPDVNSLTARFPYAIRLDHPMEYRVIEINTNGEITSSQWIRRNNWSEVIDVTTPDVKNRIRKKSLDLELDIDSMISEGYNEAKCELNYRLNGSDVQQRITWKTGDEQTLRNILISYDISSPVRYRMVWADNEANKIVTPYQSIPSDESYIFIATPSN